MRKGSETSVGTVDLFVKLITVALGRLLFKRK